jgi:hypothetical protein
MKAWVWPVIASAGFALMVFAYGSRQRIDVGAPWARGAMIIGPLAPAEKGADVGAMPVRLRLLSSSNVAELAMFASGDLAPARAIGVKAQVRVKLIELPQSDAGIGAGELQSGRLPEVGHNEVLAGAKLEQRETLLVGGQSLNVVGVLRPGVVFFADSYLLPPDAANDRLFSTAVPTVFHAWLLKSSPEELRQERIQKPLEAAFPPEKYTWVAADERLDPWSFRRYLAGLAIFLLGGSGMCIAFFRWLSGKIASPVLSGPLLEMKARPRLVWAVHLIYFGLAIAGSLIIAELPEAQIVLLGKVREAFTTQNNPLGIAGQVYRSGNVVLAAAITLAVNFFLGSLAYITLPSILVPGIGFLLACVRALAWGLLLAPTTQPLAFAMLPHSLTMLLEGEGYILAAVFGLLIPLHVVKRSLGANLFTRFGRALLLNLKAQIWIALVLAVAAIYEATEVILMTR